MTIYLKQFDAFIGHPGLNQIHDGTLAPFIAAWQQLGGKNKTINHALSVVRRVLTLSARRWRDEDTGLTWLETPPLITMLPIKGKYLPATQKSCKPYPLTWDEQARLLRHLPDHLAQMVLYKVNVGGREEEICSLRWDWEQALPELNTLVFYIPEEVTKNEESRVHVLSRIARSVIEARRLARPEQHLPKCKSRKGKDCNCTRSFVFGYSGRRMRRMNNSAWRRAWRNSGLPVDDEYKRGVHNLKHTFGRRLRAADVPLETRKVLLGHTNGDITTHYSAAELHELIDAVERLCGQISHKSPTLTLLRPQASEQEVC